MADELEGFAEVEEETEIESEYPISDEPELVAEISTAAQDSLFQPSQADSPVEDIHLASTVCDVCLELNLTHKDQVITCVRCEQAFCFHYASNVDAQYCVNCMSDINVTKQVITKEYVHRDEREQVTSVYRRRAREIKIGGLDWLFAQRKIYELSDVELDLTIEYHRNLLMLMIAEQEQRRNAKLHRYAGIKAIPTPATTSVVSSTTTTVKKTRTISKTKAAEQLAALLGTMKIDSKMVEQIAAMMNKGK